jgi:signal peptidase
VAEKGQNGRGSRRRSGVVLFFRDAGVAALIVASILLTMYAFAGQWPPLVVVESESMMHGDNNMSHLGVIDTGDLVLVQKVESTKDIVTYVEGYLNGHKTYGDYGDVVIYKVNGQTVRTPIIHRAILYLEANADGSSYRVDALRDFPASKWSSSNSADTWDHLTGVLSIYNVGYYSLPVVIDIPHLSMPYVSGYITKGDHNTVVDQFSGGSPVRFSWVVGKARGEIPWFGLLKLWSTGTLGSPAPQNSVEYLYASIAIIVIAPILIDLGMTYKEKRRSRKRRIIASAQGMDISEDSEDPEKDGDRDRL